MADVGFTELEDVPMTWITLMLVPFWALGFTRNDAYGRSFCIPCVVSFKSAMYATSYSDVEFTPWDFFLRPRYGSRVYTEYVTCCEMGRYRFW